MSSTTTTTRTRRTPAERSAEIVTAATALAREQGLSALTLRSVADRAGVASSLIAHYHPAVDDLVARVYTDLVEAELAEVHGLVSRVESAASRFGSLLETLLDGSREDLTVVWVEGWAMSRRNDALARAVRVQMGRWHRLVAGIVDDGIAEGVFTVDDAAGVAWQLLGMIDGLNAQSLVRGADQSDVIARMSRAAETLLGARPGDVRSLARADAGARVAVDGSLDP